MICMLIGVFLSCNATGPIGDIQVLQPRTYPQEQQYITGVPDCIPWSRKHMTPAMQRDIDASRVRLCEEAASTTRHDIVDEMIAAHLRAEREGRLRR